MWATDHTEVKLFVLLLLVGIIEVVQEFLEETTFHRDRISSDGYRSRVLYHRNMRNR